MFNVYTPTPLKVLRPITLTTIMFNVYATADMGICYCKGTCGIGSATTGILLLQEYCFCKGIWYCFCKGIWYCFCKGICCDMGTATAGILRR